MSREDHWQALHAEKHTNVSWWQDSQALWFDLIQQTHLPLSAPVIDVGGGASLLVDELVRYGYDDVTLLDIAQSALDRVRSRLDQKISYVRSDVTDFRSDKKFSLWHDRAVFHFLVTDADQAAYRESVTANTCSDGFVILSTFADDGPEKCSGLEVARYSERELASALGSPFEVVAMDRRSHMTPWGSEQKFVSAVFRKKG